MGIDNFQTELIKKSYVIETSEFKSKYNKDLENKKDDLWDRMKSLDSLGFKNSLNYRLMKKESDKINSSINIKHSIFKNESSYKNLFESIPNLLVLDYKSFEDICKKNNLVMTKIDRYLGYVPDECIKYLKNFRDKSYKISSSDYTYGLITSIELKKKASRLFSSERKKLNNLLKYQLGEIRNDWFSSSEAKNVVMYNLGLSTMSLEDRLNVFDAIGIKDIDYSSISMDSIMVAADESLCKKFMYYEEENIDNELTYKNINKSVDKLIFYLILPNGNIGILATHGSMTHDEVISYFNELKDINIS